MPGAISIRVISLCNSKWPACPSVTFCFLNILESHCWNFIRPCKNIHIYKTNTFNKKVWARGQFYYSYFPLSYFIYFILLYLHNFKWLLYRVYAYAIIVPSWVDQLLPQFLMEQFDTLPSHCGHIGHMHEGV